MEAGGSEKWSDSEGAVRAEPVGSPDGPCGDEGEEEGNWKARGGRRQRYQLVKKLVESYRRVFRSPAEMCPGIEARINHPGEPGVWHTRNPIPALRWRRLEKYELKANMDYIVTWRDSKIKIKLKRAGDVAH